MLRVYQRACWLTVFFFLVLVAVGTAPVGAGPKFTSGLIAQGEPSETPYYIQRTDRDGPTVFVIGGMHGNEPAGAEAAEQIRHWSLTRGTLIVVPRANPPALDANSRFTPGKERSARNLNRNFPRIEDEPNSTRGRTAEVLWQLVQQHRPDWVLDLHEGFSFHVSNSNSVGSSIIHVDEPETNRHVKRMLEVVNAEVEDEDKRFVSIPRGPVNSGLVRAALAHLDVEGGMILETTYRDQPLSLRTRQHRLMVHRFLSDLDMLQHDPHVLAPPYGDRYPDAYGTSSSDVTLRMAIYQGPGAGASGIRRVREIVDEMPDARAMLVRPEDIRDGALRGFDAVAFTGGGGRSQGVALGEQGRDQVRLFVADGGGFLGICAGAYLATCRLEDYLHMVPTYHHQPWRSGGGRVEIELTDTGRQWLDAPGDLGPFDVRFNNGPLFFHEDGRVPDVDLPEFEVLAYFRTAVRTDEDAWQQAMVDTPAIVGTNFGQGQVVLVSPHPESDANRQWVIENTVRHIAGQGEVTFERELLETEAAFAP